MKKLIFCFTFFLLICLTLSLPVTAQIVNIPALNLRAAVEDALGKASGATITPADMTHLTHLEASEKDIRNLAGLEHATNLTVLNFDLNSVSDLSPLAGLTNLTGLYLVGNSVLNL